MMYVACGIPSSSKLKQLNIDIKVNAVIIKLYSDVLSRLNGREFIIGGDRYA